VRAQVGLLAQSGGVEQQRTGLRDRIASRVQLDRVVGAVGKRRDDVAAVGGELLPPDDGPMLHLGLA